MTEYERICAERSANSLNKLIAAAQEPISAVALAEILNVSKGYVRSMILGHPQHFKEVARVRGSGNSKMVIYQAVTRVEIEIVNPNKKTYLLQDNDKYHDNMKLLRENRKPLRVFVAGATLA